MLNILTNQKKNTSHLTTHPTSLLTYFPTSTNPNAPSTSVIPNAPSKLDTAPPVASSNSSFTLSIPNPSSSPAIASPIAWIVPGAAPSSKSPSAYSAKVTPRASSSWVVSVCGLITAYAWRKGVKDWRKEEGEGAYLGKTVTEQGVELLF